MGGTSAVPLGRPLPSVHGRALGEEVALFMSTYVNKVDRKGRVSVPATFRTAIADQSFDGIVAFPSLDYEALEATGIDRMEAVSARLDELEQPDEQQSLATLIPPDLNGCLLILRAESCYPKSSRRTRTLPRARPSLGLVRPSRSGNPIVLLSMRRHCLIAPVARV